MEPQVVAQAVHVPSPPLSDYIEVLWYHELRDYRGRELILPSPFIELIFNFGNPHKVLDLADFARFEWQREGWLAGMQTRVLAIESTTSHMIGARFKPGGLHAFGVQPAEFTDRVAPVQVAYGQAALDLQRALQSDATAEQRFARLEAFLAQRFAPEPDNSALVRSAVAELERSQGTRPLAELSETLGVSHKHFTQLFTRLVGTRPKQFARMLRFNSVVAALDVSQPVDWNAVAHSAGFYDQPHFINEFKAFTGLTPLDYLTRWRALQAKPVEYDPRFLPLG